MIAAFFGASLAVFAPLVGQDGTTFDIVVVEAAMAPMLGATVVAAEHSSTRRW